MKLTIPQPALANLIERGAAAVAKKAQLEILTSLRLIAEGEVISIASSDQDRFAEAHGSASIEAPGALCVDKAAFGALVKKHPKSGTISLEVVDGRLVVSCGRSCVKLPIFPADTFPKWADGENVATFALPAKDLERAFNRVRYAAASDTTQWHLQGVHLDFHDGRLHFVATDSNRMAVSGMTAPDGAEDCPKIIIPSETVEAAIAVFKDAADVTISVSKIADAPKAISFAADNLRLAARLIDGSFPPYEKIIPARGAPGIIVRRSDFVDCLDRANVMVGQGAFSGITARPDGDILRLEARNHKGGEALEEMSAVIGDGIQPFGFNSLFAAQFLSTLNVDELVIEQTGPDVPHLIYSDDAPDFVGVLAPMRVA